MNFLMVIMASGIARGRVRTTTTTTTTTESRKMAAILQVIGWQRHAALVYRFLLWYWTSMLWSIDTCQNKVSADQYYVTISRAQVCSSSRSRFFLSWPLTNYWFSSGSRAHVMLTCWKPSRIVREPANGSPRLKFIWIITFSSIQMFFAALFWVWLVCSITQSKINIITIQWIKPGILDAIDEAYIKHLAKIQLCAVFHSRVIREKCFTQIYRALYGNAMLVPFRGAPPWRP